MRFDVLRVDKCPLEWWRQHKQFFPGLAAVARHFRCLPATSAAVERFFSAAGITISHLRTRLAAETVEQLLYLKLNWTNELYNVRLPPRPQPAQAGAAGAAAIVIEDEEERETDEDEGAQGEGINEEDEFFALGLLSLAAELTEPEAAAI